MSLREAAEILRQDFACNPEWLDRLTLVVFRWGQYARHRSLAHRLLWRMVDTFYLRLLVGAELPPAVECGPGLRLPHQGRGVVLHPQVVLGSDVWLYHGVTIGARGSGTPRVGDRVYIGTGAAILGDLSVGDDAKVGAHALVVRDVPAGSSAVSPQAQPI